MFSILCKDLFRSVLDSPGIEDFTESFGNIQKLNQDGKGYKRLRMGLMLNNWVGGTTLIGFLGAIGVLIMQFSLTPNLNLLTILEKWPGGGKGNVTACSMIKAHFS